MSELLVTSNKITSKWSNRYLKIGKSPFKITNQGLLIKTLKMFRILGML